MERSHPRYLLYWGKAQPGQGYLAEWHPAAYHMLDVAAVGFQLLAFDDRLSKRLEILSGLTAQNIQRWLFLSLALHDLGKFFPYFQNKVPELHEAAFGPKPSRGVQSRHDIDGLFYWNKILRKNPAFLSRIAASPASSPIKPFEQWVMAALSHHGRPQEVPKAILSDHLPAPYSEDIGAFVDDVLLLADEIGEAVGEAAIAPQIQSSWLIAGLSVLCDWLGSNRDWFFYPQPSLSLADYWRNHALPQAKKAIRDAHLLSPEPNHALAITDLLPANAEPSPLQNAVHQLQLGDGPVLAIIEDQTGAGKTEAALALAERMMTNGQGDGLFIALPTMATANAMYRRCERHYRHLFANGAKPSIVLAHSKRELVLNEPKLAASASIGDDAKSADRAAREWIADDRRKASLADCGIGTVDQAVMAVLPSFYQSLRLIGLSRKVLVLDEVHAHDAYLGGLVAGLLRFHAALGGSAILLSATLPAEHKRRYAAAFAEGGDFPLTDIADEKDAYPQITLVNRQKAERIAVAPKLGLGRKVTMERLNDETAVLERIVAAASSGQAVAWIRNTVGDAVTAATALRHYVSARLFHARFAMGDRLDIESDIETLFGKGSTPQQRRGQVLIATQVAEQSLDLDFDLMVSDLAPMDALIQRAGRLWRHTRPERQGHPHLLLLSPDPTGEIDAQWYSRPFPKAAYVYQDPLVVWRTARELVNRGGMILPEQARDLIETAYAQDTSDAPQALIAKHLDAEGKGWGDAATAKAHLLSPRRAYGERDKIWDDDIHVPTRLGEKQSQLRLARWVDGKLSPWYESEGPNAWRLSELTVMRNRVASEAPDQDPDLRKAIESAKRTWPGPEDAALLIPLYPQGDAWVGTAQNGQEKPVTLSYHPETGLEFGQYNIHS